MRATNKAKAGFGWAVGAGMLLSWQAPLPAVTVPPKLNTVPPDINTVPAKYVVINGLNVRILCAVVAPDSSLRRGFWISAGAQWASSAYDSYSQIRLYCQPPVPPIYYQLKKGKRYVLLRRRGRVELVEVVTRIGRTQ